jgi:hypothetical protein
MDQLHPVSTVLNLRKLDCECGHIHCLPKSRANDGIGRYYLQETPKLLNHISWINTKNKYYSYMSVTVICVLKWIRRQGIAQ